MFLSFFILRFFSIVIPAQAGIHCAAGICVAFATTLFTWVPVSSTGMTHLSFFLNKLQNEKQPQNKLITTKLQNKKTKKPVILWPGPRATCRVGGCRPQDPGHKTPVRQHRQYFVIAREHRDRGDPVSNLCRRTLHFAL